MAVASGAQAQVALDRLVRSRPAAAPFADGFDFPVGKPDARGYYRARGFRAYSHPGEDWDGVDGGDSDFNDPVSSIGDGEVVFAGDARLGWGNVVIVRHQFREKGEVQTIDAFFAHLNTILVRRGQRVVRGQQIGTIGTAHGRYDAHLHFEIRKNLAISTNRAAFPSDFSCYYDPTKFIASHRRLETRSVEGPYVFNRVLLGQHDPAAPRPPRAAQTSVAVSRSVRAPGE